MKRREFIKKASSGVVLTSLAGTGCPLLTSCNNHISKSIITFTIPIPIQIVIDDVGWWSGKDGSAYQEPFRTGINRNHVKEDYLAIIELGKALGVRPQAEMILCEWDRENILRKIPHSTWMGEKWDNKKWIGPWLDEVAGIIRDNERNFEISMHGLAHEWWINGILSRAEWADDDGIMRPKELVEKHIEAFASILKQNNLGELPKSFVPTNFSHTFGISKGNNVSMAEILKKYGFTYLNTTFNYNFHNLEKVQYDLFGVDSGILTVDRGTDLLDWNIIGEIPEGEIKGCTCGMHWANLLHENPQQNSEIVDGWVNVLAPYKNKVETMLPENSVYFQQQLAHHVTTKIGIDKNELKLDFAETNRLATVLPNHELTVKISARENLSFASSSINILSVNSIKSNDSILYSLSLKKKDNSSASISISRA